MANVLLGVTGSVAAIKVPELFAELRQLGHTVKVVATRAALYFFDPVVLSGQVGATRDRDTVILDEDEWPGRDAGMRYQRSDEVLHIELRRWANLLLIAPLDANTLAKLASGLCDNCLTCVWRAWDPTRPVVLAPAMNTLMWQHPATLRHLSQLAADTWETGPPGRLTTEELLDWINTHCPRLRIVPPESKLLACNDIGNGALASLPAITATVQNLLVG
jgi:phosphopantothenoylcysteine decarboxylase